MSDIRQASLEPGSGERVPGFLAQAGPFAILAFGALWLHRRFDQLPARLPIHWNWRGEPDGFVNRSAAGAALPLLLGLGICALMLAMQIALRRSTPPPLAGPRPRVRQRSRAARLHSRDRAQRSARAAAQSVGLARRGLLRRSRRPGAVRAQAQRPGLHVQLRHPVVAGPDPRVAGRAARDRALRRPQRTVTRAPSQSIKSILVRMAAS